MSQYLLLLHESESDFAGFSPEEIQKIIQEYRVWTKRLMDEKRIVHNNKLTDEPGKVLRPGNDEIIITDGPYSETKELVGGYYVIEAADYTEAIEIAKTSPHLRYGGRIEVREIHQLM